MICAWPYEEDEMALNTKDLEAVEKLIQKALREIGAFSRTRKFLYGLRDWGLTALLITAPLALIGIVVALGIRVVSDVKEEATFRAHTTDALEHIRGDIRALQAPQYPGRVFSELQLLEQREFALNLPALQKVVEQPSSKVAPTQAAIEAVAGKLRQTPEDTPDYWPTVYQFVQFGSSGLSTDVPPPDAPFVLLSNLTVIGFPSLFDHKRLILDGGGLKNLIIRNARIEFTDRAPRLENVTFINCVFEFPVPYLNTPYLERAARQLLVSNFSKISSAG
jgi:hypothetical protein